MYRGRGAKGGGRAEFRRRLPPYSPPPPQDPLCTVHRRGGGQGLRDVSLCVHGLPKEQQYAEGVRGLRGVVGGAALAAVGPGPNSRIQGLV